MENSGIHVIGKCAASGLPVQVQVKEGHISKIEAIAGETESGKLPWISPGWIDLQVNGYGGFDLNTETTSVEDVCGLSTLLHARGVTSYFPTVITGSFERIRQAVATIGTACERHLSVARSVAGIHLEGPYLSSEDGPRGAHDRRFIRKPDWDEFRRWQEASDGRIRLVTIAPETGGAIAFIAKLVESGVTVSIGHTMATGDLIEQAVRAGATMSTHLGNGAHPVLPRHPNYIWDQLAHDGLWATFIADGHHVPLNVLQSMLRAKGSKAIVVSDSVSFGGLPPGRYKSLIGAEVELHPNGRLNTVHNPAILAGSAQALDEGVSGLLRIPGMTLTEAIEAVTSRPAEAMGLRGHGRLEVGGPANLVLFDFDEDRHRLVVRETILHGQSVYKPGGPLAI